MKGGLEWPKRIDPTLSGGCTASRSPRSWSARACRTCGPTRPAGYSRPERTDGGTRRYSADDLDRLRRIGDLLNAGLNLAGISMVLDLENQNSELRADKEPRS